MFLFVHVYELPHTRRRGSVTSSAVGTVVFSIRWGWEWAEDVAEDREGKENWGKASEDWDKY